MKSALRHLLGCALVGALFVAPGCGGSDGSNSEAETSDTAEYSPAAGGDNTPGETSSPSTQVAVDAVDAGKQAPGAGGNVSNPLAAVGMEVVASDGESPGGSEDLETVKTPVPKSMPQGRKAPEFDLATLTGDRITLSEFSGQVVLVDFWATWCGPCRRSIPHLIELQKELGERGFTIVGVSLDRGGPEMVSRYALRMGINYPLAMGSAEMTQAYGGSEGIKFIPTAFLVDRNGYIAKKITGLQPKESLRQDILKVLEG